MADMKMRRDGDGYLLTITPGQMKKWNHLKREIAVNGKVQNQKWNDTEYALTIDADIYKVTALANESEKSYNVKVTNEKMKQSVERTYRTWECNDCVMRMLLEVHNTVLSERKEQERKDKKKKQA
jgi:hypothetical protein